MRFGPLLARPDTGSAKQRNFYIFAMRPRRKTPVLLGEYSATWPNPAIAQAQEDADYQQVTVNSIWYVENNSAIDALLRKDEKAAIKRGPILQFG